MVGVGPFITIPLIIASMGGPQCMLGWLLGAILSIADGLVWSELSAALPGTGGSYVYLREAFRGTRWGGLLPFLFIWQFVLSGPLEISSGYIGFAQYSGYLWKGMGPWGMRGLAVGVGCLVMLMLYRRIEAVGRLTVVLWLGMLATVDLPAQLQWLPGMVGQLQHGQPLFMVLYGALIIFFSFFYTSIVFNPEDTAENLRKYGGFLPGIRPGKRTAEYLDFVLTRLTVIGAAYITLVCLMPEALIGFYKAPFYLGGTSILIVVSVTMDTVTQIQSHLLAHQYEGLIKKSKLRGGRGR